MANPIDNETWLIDTGDEIVRKEAQDGSECITPWERLIYCLWVADYGMRNAGDLTAARDVYADFQSEGARIAKALSLPLTHAAFSLSPIALANDYFGRFDAICRELQEAQLGKSRST